MNNQPDDTQHMNEFEIALNKVEKLLPGQKILLAGPTFLGTLVIQMRGFPDVTQSLIMTLFDEWGNIYNTLVDLVGRENLIVLRNHVIVGNKKPGRLSEDLTLDNLETQKISLPGALDSHLGIENFEWLQGEFLSWPRNAFSVIGGQTLVNNSAWSQGVLAERFEAIGDAGRIITAPNSKVAFVTSEVKKLFPKEVEYLKSLRIKVGELPLANTRRKKGRFPSEDIDGFVLQINHNGQDFLYVAKSYIEQSKDDEKLIKQSTQKTNTQLRIVNDSDLDHLAFNGIVFNDDTVLLACAEDSQLVKAIARDIGKERVFTIPPLTNISALTGGGLGCLTNTLETGIIPVSES